MLPRIDSQLKIPMRLLLVWHHWVHGQYCKTKVSLFHTYSIPKSLFFHISSWTKFNKCVHEGWGLLIWSDESWEKLVHILNTNEDVPCKYLYYGFLRAAVLDINVCSGKTARQRVVHYFRIIGYYSTLLLLGTCHVLVFSSSITLSKVFIWSPSSVSISTKVDVSTAISPSVTILEIRKGRRRYYSLVQRNTLKWSNCIIIRRESKGYV